MSKLFVWIEFLSTCLPESVKKFYLGSWNQELQGFQVFDQNESFWIRMPTKETDRGFFFSIYNKGWINLPFTIHEEVNNPSEKGDYCINIAGYYVRYEPIEPTGNKALLVNGHVMQINHFPGKPYFFEIY